MRRWRSSCRCWRTASPRQRSRRMRRRQYRLAALRTLAELADPGALGSSLRSLLGSLDNDQSSLVDLLAGLLPRREQWLGHLAGRRAPELRAELERALEHLVIDELRSLTALWPAHLLAELNELLAHAAANLSLPDARAALAECFREPAPREPAVRLAGWQAAARLLLTQDGKWRQRITKTDGLGPEHPAAMQRWRALLATLTAHEPLRLALRAIAALPAPRFDDRQWESLAALQVVLVRLSAELKVVFAEQRCVDFVELSLAAQRALGHAEAPSELLLALDRRIQHLLVDEFQDTSQAQLRLLSLLTSGWQPGDGRSLFLVGDPMQSIYRFRDAEMSLFLRVKERGIGQVPLTPLRLQRNFRSSPAVVDWVNRVFATVFPPLDDLDGGLAGFAPSMAVRDSAARQFVRVHPLWGADPRAEVEKVIDIVGDERAARRPPVDRSPRAEPHASRRIARAPRRAGLARACSRDRRTRRAADRPGSARPDARADAPSRSDRLARRAARALVRLDVVRSARAMPRRSGAHGLGLAQGSAACRPLEPFRTTPRRCHDGRAHGSVREPSVARACKLGRSDMAAFGRTRMRGQASTSGRRNSSSRYSLATSSGATSTIRQRSRVGS